MPNSSLGKAVHSLTSLEANDHPYDDGTFLQQRRTGNPQ